MTPEKRGSIAFFTTYRPPLPLDIFSCPHNSTSEQDELQMTDGVSYNYNGQVIPSAALKTILKRRPKLASEGNEDDVNSGRLSGMVFVSERGNLETLQIALRFNDNPPTVKVFSFADVFDTFNGVRMEDSGCIAGDYLVYVSTKEAAKDPRQPWTAIYKTNLITGKTDRLTPSAHADLSPSVSPSGKKIAVASFEEKGGWDGEIEDLKTDIFVMNVDGDERGLVVSDGGWPTWGSDNVIFFHRKVGELWGVFRADISSSEVPSRVTPDDIDAMTPAAINSTTVAVATIRKPSKFGDVSEEAQYRHIEMFHSDSPKNIKITQKTRPKAHHFNPFVIDGGNRIGYHRCKSEHHQSGDHIQGHFDKIKSPHPDVGLFRVSGGFPTFSSDGSKLAFVDNRFESVWVADSQRLHRVFETKGPDNIFSPVWNQNPQKDILYVCMGPSFHAKEEVNIVAIPVVAGGGRNYKQLTKRIKGIPSNNAFPSTNPDGTKLVFRSTRNGGDKNYKNLYIMHDANVGEYGDGTITRLTEGHWTDTHCQWDPRGEWIVFSSNRDKPENEREKDKGGLDSGYFVVYLVKWNKPDVLVRVIASGSNLAGHVNHPFFSPDGNSIVVTSDLAAVSADPISLPLVEHSARPYGDIFTFDIDRDDINKNKINVKKFNRITHSRYENSTGTWTLFSTHDSKAAWNWLLDKAGYKTLSCPYAYGDGRRK